MALGSNKPIILFCAENFGFGPAGLACAVAEEFVVKPHFLRLRPLLRSASIKDLGGVVRCGPP